MIPKLLHSTTDRNYPSEKYEKKERKEELSFILVNSVLVPFQSFLLATTQFPSHAPFAWNTDYLRLAATSNRGTRSE